MDPVNRTLRVALIGSPPEDRDLVAVLVSQYRRSRVEVEAIAADEGSKEIAARRHDAYLIPVGSTVPAGELLFQQAAATGRAVILLTEGEDDERDDRLVASGAWDCLVTRSLTPPVLGRAVTRAVAAAQERLLSKQRDQAQRLDALARFAGQVAHDFNNLLTAMLGYAEMLRESLGPSDPRREDVREIQRAGERATALTRQLLAFGRRQVARPRVLDVNALLQSLEPALRALAGADIEFAFVAGRDLPPVRADAAQIEQLITSLATNAKEAMPSGGRLTVETRRVDLGVEWAADRLGARPGPHVMIAVCDTGCGMAPEVRARLFEPFFTTKPKGRGTGLSLAITDGIVRQAGGHLSVESEPGRGTTVSIYLPAGVEQA